MNAATAAVIGENIRDALKRKREFPEEPITRRPIVSRRPCWGGIETVDYNYDPPRVTREPSK